MGLIDFLDDLRFELEWQVKQWWNRGQDGELAQGQGEQGTSDENDFRLVTISGDVSEIVSSPSQSSEPAHTNPNKKYEQYPVPELLRWAIFCPYRRYYNYKCTACNQKCTLPLWEFRKESKRLQLIADTLAYGLQELRATYGVWDIYDAFRGRLSLHNLEEMARLLESVGILIKPPQRNRPRWINVKKANQFISTVAEWVKSEPVLK